MHDIFFSTFNSKLISLLGYTWIIHASSVIGSRRNYNCRSRCRPAEYRCIMWYRSNLDCIMELRPTSILYEFWRRGRFGRYFSYDWGDFDRRRWRAHMRWNKRLRKRIQKRNDKFVFLAETFKDPAYINMNSSWL